MKSRIILFLSIIINTTYGQYGIVRDKDGYINIRSEKSSSSKIIDTIHSGKIVYFFEPEGEWYDISYLKSKKNISGFVHKSRVTFIKEFKEIKPTLKTKNKIEFQFDSIHLKVITEPFIPKNNKISYTTPTCRLPYNSSILKL